MYYYMVMRRACWVELMCHTAFGEGNSVIMEVRTALQEKTERKETPESSRVEDMKILATGNRIFLVVVSVH